MNMVVHEPTIKKPTNPHIWVMDIIRLKRLIWMILEMLNMLLCHIFRQSKTLLTKICLVSNVL